MSNPTPAQEEFAAFLDKNSRDSLDDIHPEDRDDVRREAAERSEDEEDGYLAQKIDEAMRMPTMDSNTSLRLPPAAFDSGHYTGVKGVIADARSYETARRTTWKDKARAVRRSVFGFEGHRQGGSDSEGSGAEDPDEEEFLQQWRESRRRELEQESRAPVRTRRTSPSARMYGRLEEVDALGYLDAIEKVGRETNVVVFVYDHECQVSAAIEGAILPLVTAYPTVRFVKVHYEDIEFDNAAVPAVLAYRNQGDLFANLTGILELIPEDEDFDTESLKKIFSKHDIL
ncbi:thioredoxin-like protein [Cladorrhinum sp. PSN259]|nr:thioredoxin-like protein [Cladorrhinum sp. PSN259]